jgi:hypothetical protein
MKSVPIIHDDLVYELRRTGKRRGFYSTTRRSGPKSGSFRVAPQTGRFVPGPCDNKNAGDPCGPGMVCNARGGECVYL